jgi:histidinol-phosphate aminotransferase
MVDHFLVPEGHDGVRLHQNENTAGCSPRVLAALASLSRTQIGSYPSYRAAGEACARHLGVTPDRVLLTNGLDAGIMAVSMSYLRPPGDGTVPEAVIPEPAFEVFALDTAGAGGRAVHLPPEPDFVISADAVLKAVTPSTRVVFLTNPNNPTGITVPPEAVETIARTMAPGAIVFVDEAYVDIGGESFIPRLEGFPNVIVGRSFSKAHGLAGLRVGALVGVAEALDRIRGVLPLYNVNAAAVVAIQAALEDIDYVTDYVREAQESKALLYAACDRLGLAYWRSAANFVLIRTGALTDALSRAASARRIRVRSGLRQPGCDGCIRVTAGRVEETRRWIALMEEVIGRPDAGFQMTG